MTALDAGAVRAVLADADGNLFPSEEPAFVASTEVTNRLMAELGSSRRFTATQLRLATTGMNFRSTAAALAAEEGAALEPGALEAWVQEEKRAVTAHLRTALHPDPGVLDPLTRLARRHEVAAVSSSADARIAACFEVTGLAGFFPPDRRFSAEDSLPRPTSKPDPAIYLFAGQRLGLAAHEAVAVEDSVPGATSAVAAGFPTLGNLQFVAPEERDERRAALEAVGVEAVVEDWSEVADRLGAGGRVAAAG